MQIGVVEGTAVSTIKHRTLQGWRLILVQPLAPDGGPDGDILLVLDNLGAGHGCRVLLSSDGRGALEMIGDRTAPVRWHVIGILDEQ